MTRIALVDTATLAHALGGPGPHRGPAQAVVDAAIEGQLDLHASVEMVQELVFHRLRRGTRAAAVEQGRDAASLCTLHDFDRAVLDRALLLMAEHDGVRGRDAVHAATALLHGLDTVISPDPAFDLVPGLSRLDPRDL